MQIESWIKGSLCLGGAALLAIVVAQLALADIYHGEDDLSQEWNALRVCFGVVLVAQVASLTTLARILRRGRQAGPA